MTTQILATKLFIPPPRPDLVSRSRLLDHLESGAACKLTLISAQAGSGKSTLLGEWIRQSDRPVAWLSLDERDNDLNRFLRYFIIALQQIEKRIGTEALVTLQSSQRLEAEPLLTGLIYEITEIHYPFSLVFDDYHVINAPEIQQALLFWLDHQPQGMHLVISSRADPPWPLSRMRVRGEIVEIRSQEMRFTLEEAGEFLNEVMGLDLSQEAILALERRTEGWIVGLQLAALSMRQQADREGFIRAFTGSHRYVMDYLLEEVLDQQSSEIREFLLKTSILKRLSGPLCDVVAGEKNSQNILLDLEQRNLFLIPLDDERRWYRYHHLFADLLKNRLGQTRGDEMRDLHKRASLWYEENGLLPDAINHALAANEIGLIAHLAEEMVIYRMDYGELTALLSWLGRLPEATMIQYPWLLVTRAWAFFYTGRYEVVDENLAEIESVLASDALPAELATRIRGHVAAIQSYLAELREDPESAMRQAESSLALLPEKDIMLRSFVAIRWANCLVWFGEFEKGIQVYQEAGEASKLVGDGQSAIIALSEMAAVQMIHGKLRQAVENITGINSYADMLARRDGRRLPAVGLLYRHTSTIKRQQNELSEASYYAREAVKICEQWGEKEALLFGLLALARVRFAQGKYRQVEQGFRRIMQLAGQISPLAVLQFQDWVLYFQLLRGKTEEAERWVQAHGLAVDDEIRFERRFEYQNYARLLLAKGYCSQALKVMNTLLMVVTGVGAGLYMISYRVLLARILYAQNQLDEALIAIQEALSMARPEGYVRAILDEGESVEELLRAAIARGIEVEYAGQLLAALRDQTRSSTAEKLRAAGIADPLSPREMEVLRLLVTDLTTPEIADELVVSVSTVRSHIKNIYSKLDTHSRHEAVTRAKELNLL